MQMYPATAGQSSVHRFHVDSTKIIGPGGQTIKELRAQHPDTKIVVHTERDGVKLDPPFLVELSGTDEAVQRAREDIGQRGIHLHLLPADVAAVP